MTNPTTIVLIPLTDLEYRRSLDGEVAGLLTAVEAEREKLRELTEACNREMTADLEFHGVELPSSAAPAFHIGLMKKANGWADLRFGPDGTAWVIPRDIRTEGGGLGAGRSLRDIMLGVMGRLTGYRERVFVPFADVFAGVRKDLGWCPGEEALTEAVRSLRTYPDRESRWCVVATAKAALSDAGVTAARQAAGLEINETAAWIKASGLNFRQKTEDSLARRLPLSRRMGLIEDHFQAFVVGMLERDTIRGRRVAGKGDRPAPSQVASWGFNHARDEIRGWGRDASLRESRGAMTERSRKRNDQEATRDIAHRDAGKRGDTGVVWELGEDGAGAVRDYVGGDLRDDMMEILHRQDAVATLCSAIPNYTLGDTAVPTLMVRAVVGLGLTLPEIAAATDLPEDTLKAELENTKTVLRTAWKHDEEVEAVLGRYREPEKKTRAPRTKDTAATPPRPPSPQVANDAPTAVELQLPADWEARKRRSLKNAEAKSAADVWVHHHWVAWLETTTKRWARPKNPDLTTDPTEVGRQDALAAQARG